MGAGKWIGGIIGFMAGGPLGALAGYALGSLIELGGNTASYTTDYGNGQTEEDVFAGQRNSFLFSMLVMASYIIRADGRIMHSEMEYVRNFLRTNFGVAAVGEGERILLNLFEQRTYMGLSEKEVESMLNLGGNSLEAAYKVLEILPTATDEEVRAAYRKLVLKHHPDRVATLGEDIKRAAEEKLQDINNAKEIIYKARGIK